MFIFGDHGGGGSGIVGGGNWLVRRWVLFDALAD